MYAYGVAKHIDWYGPMDLLLVRALTHDMDELITGDLTYPVKRAIVDKDRADDYIRRGLEQKVPEVAQMISTNKYVDEAQQDEMRAIVKVADWFDATFKIQMEAAMGNQIMLPRFKIAMNELYKNWLLLPFREGMDAQVEWDKHVIPTVREHDRPASYDHEVTS